MSERGLTIFELVVVIVLIGLIAVFGIPRFGDAITQQNVKSARNAVLSLHAKARAAAIQRGRSTALLFDGNTCVLRYRNPLTGQLDTLGVPEDMFARYGVTVSSSRDSLVFDPRGLGTETSTTTIVVKKGKYLEEIEISLLGRVLK